MAFSLAGYDRRARTRADALRLPLFVLDLTKAPQPVNDPADAVLRDGPDGTRAPGRRGRRRQCRRCGSASPFATRAS